MENRFTLEWETVVKEVEEVFLCPECRQPLLPEVWRCGQGHTFDCVDGVVQLFSRAFASRFLPFQQQFEQYRAAQGLTIRQPAAYAALPYGAAARGQFEWRLRQYDLALVRRLLAGRAGRQRVLEVGAWNGWLTHWLAADGHQVTAVDYFDNEFDGLRTMKHYRRKWQAVQMDLEDLAALPANYDVVIVNRCLQFFTNPLAAVAQSQARLAAGGALLLTGLAFVRDATVAAQRAADFRAHLQAQGITYFKTFKGYLDFDDYAALQGAGVRLRWMWPLLPANVKSWLQASRPRYYYGLIIGRG